MAGLLSTLEPPAGAYGNPRTAARHSSRVLTKRRRNPLARWSLISMNAEAPKVFSAGMGVFGGKGWPFRPGGDNPAAPSGSGFFQTADGGTTWKELDDKSAKGLPAKPWGRVAVTIAPSKPNV